MVKKKIIRAKIKYSGDSKEEITSDFLPAAEALWIRNVYKEIGGQTSKDDRFLNITFWSFSQYLGHILES